MTTPRPDSAADEPPPRPPDHVDPDGAWWSSDIVPAWWVRTWPDGRIQARHRAGAYRDVWVPADADQPWYLLEALTYSRAVIGRDGRYNA